MHQPNSPERQVWLADRIPLKRFSEPREIAELALFLASSYITGADFPADGGLPLAVR